MCLVCWDDEEPIFFDLTCSHKICIECATNYVNSKVSQGLACIQCPDEHCFIAFPKAKLEKLLTPENLTLFKVLWEGDGAPEETLHPVPGLIPLYAQHGRVTKQLQHISVASSSVFYYYDCCDEHDRGWGCTYRALQSVISCLVLYGNQLTPPSPRPSDDSFSTTTTLSLNHLKRKIQTMCEIAFLSYIYPSTSTLSSPSTDTDPNNHDDKKERNAGLSASSESGSDLKGLTDLKVPRVPGIKDIQNHLIKIGRLFCSLFTLSLLSLCH